MKYVEARYKRIATIFNAIFNCEKTGNKEWLEKWEARLAEYEKDMPHGSGIDGTNRLMCKYDKAGTVVEMIVTGEYHFMNDNGMYDGWYKFSVHVRPSLQFGMVTDIRIAKRMRDYGINEYLHETFDGWFAEKIEITKEN